MEEFLAEARKQGLEVNWSKTLAADLEGKGRRPLRVLTTGGMAKEVKYVQHFKYLGRRFGGGGDEALQARIQAAWGQFWRHKAALLEQGVPQVTRLKLLDVLVAPVLLFACESLEQTRQQLDQIRKTRRQMQKRVLGWRFIGGGGADDEEPLGYDAWIQHATSKLEEMVDVRGLKRWEENAINAKWRWAGHVLRRLGDRPVLQVLTWRPQGLIRKNRGAPTRRWGHSFARLIGEDWQAATADREEWRFTGFRAIEAYRCRY